MTFHQESRSLFLSDSNSYLQRLNQCFTGPNLATIEILAKALRQAWVEHKNVYICGNGGSAANAMHIANDLHYGVGACGTGLQVPGMCVEALSANSSILTCLANDTGYKNIYSHQLSVKGREGDILIALSGSGNSENIVRAIKESSKIKMHSFAILAFTGGRCKDLADYAIHFEVDDMQVAEDAQLIVGHLCMQWLNKHKPTNIRNLR